MKQNEVRQFSLAFAKRVVFASKYLCEEKREYVLSKQFLRSGTSIGANIAEAQYAISRKDFLNKMYIALKECAETEYWIEILMGCNAIDEMCGKSLLQECGVIRRMLAKSITTAKGNQESEEKHR